MKTLITIFQFCVFLVVCILPYFYWYEGVSFLHREEYLGAIANFAAAITCMHVFDLIDYSSDGVKFVDMLLWKKFKKNGVIRAFFAKNKENDDE